MPHRLVAKGPVSKSSFSYRISSLNRQHLSPLSRSSKRTSVSYRRTASLRVHAGLVSVHAGLVSLVVDFCSGLCSLFVLIKYGLCGLGGENNCRGAGGSHSGKGQAPHHRFLCCLVWSLRASVSGIGKGTYRGMLR